MITQITELDFSLEHFSYLNKNINKDNTFLIDIETTGFSPKVNMIYLVGCIYSEDNSLKLIQWLCEKPEDEYEVLFNLAKLIQSYSYVLHYNGTNFDMPFIRKRMELLHINSIITELLEYDLFLKIRPFRKQLPLTNLKLKTVEQYYGINRSDKYTGGELISKYHEFESTHNKDLMKMLLLHNSEDLSSLYYCLHLGNIINFFQLIKHKSLDMSDLKVCKTSDYLIIDIPFNNQFNLRIENQLFDLFISTNNIALSFPIFSGELKLFFDDYENYYYLPLEDQAVHKSVGKFVEPAFRKKAKKSNCFIKKRGTFIPLNSKIEIDLTNFVKDYSATHKYVEITPNLVEDKDKLIHLSTEVLSYL